MPTPLPHDVLVLGGGVMGAAAAEALVRRGREVVLLERFAPGHTRGSSHGDGRIIRYSYPEAIYVEMVAQAYRGWARIERSSGERLVEKSGGWDCGLPDSPCLAELEASFRRAGLAYERLDAEAGRRRFPQFALEPPSVALYQADAGIVRAGRAVEVLWRLARAGGAETVTGARIVAIEADRSGVAAHAEDGRVWRARRLVLAAGGWARSLVAGLGLELPLVVSQETIGYFPIGDASERARDDHRLGVMPTFIDYHHENPFYGLPPIDVPGVKVGWHHTGPVIDPETPVPMPRENISMVADFVRTRLPHLVPEPIEVATCLYTNTPDYHFILDRHPELPNVVIGAGFSGHGFKFAPVVGEVLAALALGETPPIGLETFSVDRFARNLLEKRTGA